MRKFTRKARRFPIHPTSLSPPQSLVPIASPPLLCYLLLRHDPLRCPLGTYYTYIHTRSGNRTGTHIRQNNRTHMFLLSVCGHMFRTFPCSWSRHLPPHSQIIILSLYSEAPQRRRAIQRNKSTPISSKYSSFNPVLRYERPGTTLL